MTRCARRARLLALLLLSPLAAAPLARGAAADHAIPDEPPQTAAATDWVAPAACCPKWTFRAGAIFLKRERPQSQPYVSNIVTGATVINPANFDFPFQGGLDVAALRRGELFDVDFRYFGIDGWNASQGPVLTGPGAVFDFTGLGPLPLPTSFTAAYGSELHSVEVNIRRNVSSNLTLLAGFRHLSLREQLRVDGDFGPGFLLFDYTSRATNDLYGAQIGADAILWDSGRRLRIESAIKAGVYANPAASAVDFDIVGFGNFFSFTSARSHTAFVGDLNFTAVYDLGNRWAVRAGYQLLWLAGVALAPEQPQLVNLTTSSAAVNTSGNAFFHGAIVGLERSW